ncbi:MAG: hypothetical protein ABTQ32_25505 [Myxococcaceae bacterium]
MKAGEVVALQFGSLWREVSAPLRKKYGVAWCVGAAGANAAGAPLIRVAVADVVFDTAPTLAQVNQLELKVKPFRSNEPGIFLLHDTAFPRGVTLLGALAKRPKLTRRESTWVTYAGWSNFVIAWDAAWRREQGAAEEEATRAREAAKAAAATQKRRSRGLKGVPLAPALSKLVSKRRAEAVRSMLVEAVRSLAARSRAARLAALEALVVQLNEYDEAQRGFIDTAEREALLECLEDLAAVSGLGDVSAKLDAWREW